MLRPPRSRAWYPGSLVLVATLAITTGWAVPSHRSASGHGIVDAAAAAPQIAAATSVAARARDDALDGWSEAGAQHFANPNDTAKTSKPAAAARAAGPSGAAPTGNAQTFRGTNRFWIPSLGISRGVHSYACSAAYYPRNVMYRWGCAGTNNVYIFGHAYSVMKPLHDLYVAGRLRVGMVALYADANGRIRAYQVTEWRVVRPTEVAWQIASQPVPSMTLQTCVGKRSQFRLNVRLVAM